VPRRALLGLAAASFAVFAALAGVFWALNTQGSGSSGSGWGYAVSEAGGWTVLPATVLAVCGGLLVSGRWVEARFMGVAVAGAGVLMYAARVVLQAVGADEDGGRLSDYPSGHMTATTAFVVAVVVLTWSRSDGARLRALVAVAGVLAVLLMGWARVASGSHTALDVVGGITLALTWVAVCAVVLPPNAEHEVPRTPALVAVLAIGLVGFVSLAVLYTHEPLRTIDLDVADTIAEDLPTSIESAARPLSWLGGWIGLTTLGVAAVVLLVRERAWLDLGFFLAAYVGSQLIVVPLLKHWFDRPRPDVGSAVPLPDSASFPSGHATAGVASLGALAVLVAERLPSPRARAWLWTAVIVLGVAIGLSRIALNVHYVTDVLAGWCLGLAWLAACLLARDAIRMRRVSQNS
jgi:undecaprenyl-diphosphatase